MLQKWQSFKKTAAFYALVEKKNSSCCLLNDRSNEWSPSRPPLLGILTPPMKSVTYSVISHGTVCRAVEDTGTTRTYLVTILKTLYKTKCRPFHESFVSNVWLRFMIAYIFFYSGWVSLNQGYVPHLGVHNRKKHFFMLLRFSC